MYKMKLKIVINLVIVLIIVFLIAEIYRQREGYQSTDDNVKRKEEAKRKEEEEEAKRKEEEGQEEAKKGCTDPNAINYDASKLFDNGSCQYEMIDTIGSDNYQVWMSLLQQLLSDSQTSINDINRLVAESEELAKKSDTQQIQTNINTVETYKASIDFAFTQANDIINQVMNSPNISSTSEYTNIFKNIENIRNEAYQKAEQLSKLFADIMNQVAEDSTEIPSNYLYYSVQLRQLIKDAEDIVKNILELESTITQLANNYNLDEMKLKLDQVNSLVSGFTFLVQQGENLVSAARTIPSQLGYSESQKRSFDAKILPQYEADKDKIRNEQNKGIDIANRLSRLYLDTTNKKAQAEVENKVLLEIYKEVNKGYYKDDNIANTQLTNQYCGTLYPSNYGFNTDASKCKSSGLPSDEQLMTVLKPELIYNSLNSAVGYERSNQIKNDLGQFIDEYNVNKEEAEKSITETVEKMLEQSDYFENLSSGERDFVKTLLVAETIAHPGEGFPEVYGVFLGKNLDRFRELGFFKDLEKSKELLIGVPVHLVNDLANKLGINWKSILGWL